jgi:hypothetical protein
LAEASLGSFKSVQLLLDRSGAIDFGGSADDGASKKIATSANGERGKDGA